MNSSKRLLIWSIASGAIIAATFYFGMTDRVSVQWVLMVFFAGSAVPAYFSMLKAAAEKGWRIAPDALLLISFKSYALTTQRTGIDDALKKKITARMLYKKKHSVSYPRLAVACLVVLASQIMLPRRPDLLTIGLAVVLGWLVYRSLPFDRAHITNFGVLFRRFHGSPLLDKICRPVSIASHSLTNVVTIQDESYVGEPPSYYFAAIQILLPILILVGVQALPNPIIVFPVATIGTWLALAAYSAWVTSPIPLKKCSARTLTIAKRLKAGWRQNDGVITARYSDDAWRQAVKLFLSEADFAIIDCTSFVSGYDKKNEHVLWEIEQSFAALPSQSILLVSTNPAVSAAELIARIAAAGPRVEPSALATASCLSLTDGDGTVLEMARAKAKSMVNLSFAISRCLSFRSRD